MEDFKPVPTRASLALKNNQSNDFKTIIFEEPKTGRGKSTSKQDTGDIFESAETKTNAFKKQNIKIGNNDADDGTEFDIKKARHEVLRFAMNNQRVTKNKKKMEIFQAIKLGAKPPKKAYKNYKDLLEERKRLKNIREERKKFHMLGKNQTGAASVKCQSKTKLDKQKKKRAPVSSIDQHYGRAKFK